MESLKTFISEGYDKKINAFQQSCCQDALALYYAYITKHPENVGNGDASLEQLADVYAATGALKQNIKKHAKRYEDIIK